MGEPLFPPPAAERLMWSLSNADLVRQRELFPFELGGMLCKKRAARRAVARWRHFVATQRCARLLSRLAAEAGDVETAPLTAHLQSHPLDGVLLANHAITSLGTDILTAAQAPSVEKMMAIAQSAPLQRMIKSAAPMLDCNPELTTAMAAWRDGRLDLNSLLQTMVQSGAIEELMRAFPQDVVQLQPE